MNPFGYTVAKAEYVHTELDRHLEAVEHRFRRIKETVPGAETPVLRLDDLLEEARGVIGDLHVLVDDRTEHEAGQRA